MRILLSITFALAVLAMVATPAAAGRGLAMPPQALTETAEPPPPTDTPRPTDTPQPTDTPPPTDTPRPTDTPPPTETAQPTDTPQLPPDDDESGSDRRQRETPTASPTLAPTELPSPMPETPTVASELPSATPEPVTLETPLPTVAPPAAMPDTGVSDTDLPLGLLLVAGLAYMLGGLAVWRSGRSRG